MARSARPSSRSTTRAHAAWAFPFIVFLLDCDSVVDVSGQCHEICHAIALRRALGKIRRPPSEGSPLHTMGMAAALRHPRARPRRPRATHGGGRWEGVGLGHRFAAAWVRVRAAFGESLFPGFLLPPPALPALRVLQPCCGVTDETTVSLAGMISFQPRNHVVDEARRAAVRRVADWVEQALPEEERDSTHVMVNQVECREDGCPPIECVIALLRKPKIIFRARPRHACIAMSCCPPRPCPKGIHTPTTHSALAQLWCCVVACAVLQARGGGDAGRGVDRAERYTARGKAIRSGPPRAP